MALSCSYDTASWPECSHGPCTVRRSKDTWAFCCNEGKENRCKTVHVLTGPPPGVPPTCFKHDKPVKGAVQVHKAGKVYRVYRCEEAAKRGIAYCGRSTIASASEAVEVVSAHLTEPQGDTNAALSKRTPEEKRPVLPANCNQKSLAESNQPNNSATLPSSPEEAKETSSQHSVSLGSSSGSDELNEGAPSPEEYCKLRSKAGDTHSDHSTSESDGSPSEESREDPSMQLEHQPECSTVSHDPEYDTASSSSPEACAQLQHTCLETSSSPCLEETEDDNSPLQVVREGHVLPSHHLPRSASPFHSEEEDEDDEYMPEHDGGILEHRAVHQLDPDVIDLSPEDKPSAPRQTVLISPQAMKPVLGTAQGRLTIEKDKDAFKIARTYVKLDRQLAATDELLLKAAGLPDGGAQLRRIRQKIVAKMAGMKNPVTEPSKHATAESLLKAQRAVMNSQAKALTHGAVMQIHKSLEGQPAPEEMATEPAGLKVSLFPHQRHALAWLQWREKQKPSGGILADEMGLGKTLTMISLVLKNLPKEGKWREAGPASQGLMRSSGTLVVCPKSLMLQWEAEIGRRVERGTLRTHVHHGAGRATDPRVLATYDIVLTTYGLMSSEWQATCEGSEGKRKACAHPLFSVHWNRVVLDEAHIIRNPTTSVSQGAATLSADHRWCVTGTPIQNKQQDLYSLVRFLHLAPFDEKNVWRQQVERGQRGMERMNAVVQGLVLRRMKSDLGLNGKELVSLPAKHVNLHELVLSEVEQELHDVIFRQSRDDFVKWLHKTRGESTEEPEATETKPLSQLQATLLQFLEAKKVLGSSDDGSGFSNLLLYLLRLRQVCVHPHLVLSLRGDMAIGGGGEDDLDGLSSQLGGLNLQSASDTLEEQGSSPPVQSFMEVFQSSFISTRMKAVLESIQSIRHSGDKSIVFSQWTGMLDIVEVHLSQTGISYSRIDGTSSAKARQAIVDSFNSSSRRPEVLTISLTAGGVGLNLTGGNHVFILDLHWNPFQEGQAMDRVHRMGQTKEVYVHRFYCRSSIEERILQLQEKKRSMADNVLSGTGAKGANKLSLADLRLLFQVGE